jgi:cellulose synthase/poly-beta-1,6-N-acetylglucosamine synthase-like glycosyltransferase
LPSVFRKRTRTERFWEILPGLQFWAVLVLAIWAAKYHPVGASLFIICFDLYWVFKACNVGVHLLSSYRVFRVHVTLDWLERIQALERGLPVFIERLGEESRMDKRPVARRYFEAEKSRLTTLEHSNRAIPDFNDFFHLVLFPFVDESVEVLSTTFDALLEINYPKEKIFVILAGEERAGSAAVETARAVKEKYGKYFGQFFLTVHPDGLGGEIRGKSSNATWAVQSVLPELERLHIAIDQVIVSNFDCDTVVHPQYLARVMYEFLTAEKPYQSSYQPIAIYNNNIWDAPAFIRVVSVSNSFWQFTESSRPDRLRTFSSHSMTLRALVEVGFWKKDLVNEDGFIYWQCYLHYNGDYKVVPLFVPISLDTCLDDTTWKTFKNQYKQKKRWAYNVEYYPHLVPKLITSKAPFWDRMYKLYQYVEGNFNWATASILISTLGILPLFLGGQEFLDSVVAYNLPRVTQTLLRIAFVFIFFSIYVNLVLLPPRPAKYGKFRSVMMYLQWLLVPIVSMIFGSIPAIEAQTRLMLGRYMEFWVTPKVRKGESTGLHMKEMRDGGTPNSPIRQAQGPESIEGQLPISNIQ